MRVLRRLLVALVVTACVAVAVALGVVVVSALGRTSVPVADQCVARVADADVAVTTEQAHYAAIIVGVATQRGLVPRASTIALATVYQESGIRNLDHGDRDSLGLFQQRPSQGWGTAAQVQDPYHAAAKFFEALVKVPGWASGDVNDVAQAVQRSGHPEGYRRHVENARRLASALTGETPASFTCRVARPPAADPDGMAAFLERTLPADATVRVEDGRVIATTRTNAGAWSAAHIAVAQAAQYGPASVRLGERTWLSDGTLSRWHGEGTGGTRVTITFASPSPSPGG